MSTVSTLPLSESEGAKGSYTLLSSELLQPDSRTVTVMFMVW